VKIELDNISCGYGRNTVLRNVSFSVAAGEIVCLLGPNGVGKTTLFKTILGLIKPTEGEIKINGMNINSVKNSELARVIAYVPQAHIPPFPYTVMDVVLMGRTPHIHAFESPKDRDHTIAAESLTILGIESLAQRIYTDLSGGERQLVLVARALAQNSGIMIMDEPTSNLDFGNQIRILEIIRQLACRGLSVLMTTHSPDHAFLCSTKVVLINREKKIVEGSPERIITRTNLQKAYGIDVNIIETKTSNNTTICSCLPLINSYLTGSKRSVPD
jgi:iron complex transport system ATP-binding protein